MIEKIEIDNFRLFKHFEMDNVKQINLIAGANNVGKTSLLEAILLFDGSQKNHYNIFANRKHSDKEVQFIDTHDLFYNKDRSKPVRITLDERFIEISGNINLVNNRLQLNAKYIRDVYSLNRLCEYFSPIATDFAKLEKLVGLLQELEPRFKDLRLGVEDDKTYIIANVGLPQGLSMSSLGDGINKLLTILLTALRDDCKILLLDEIETGFHYSFYPKLWSILAKLAKETGCQIFATTHSYECIGGAKELNANEPDIFGFFRLDRDKDGNIIPKVFTQSMFETSFENGWEVR
jgi:predicted ATP-dependent endonuclease of OLD family